MLLGRLVQSAQVLVVDDEADMLDVYADTLARLEGVEASVCCSGAQALELLGQRSFDLLITNLWMPGLTGLELLSRAHELAPSLPVWVVTGDASRESVERCRAEGAARYLLKPFRPEVLQAHVLAALEVRGG